MPGIEAAHAPDALAKMAATQHANGHYERRGRLGGQASVKVRFRCDECGRVAHGGPMGMHQKGSGHAGRTRLS